MSELDDPLCRLGQPGKRRVTFLLGVVNLHVVKWNNINPADSLGSLLGLTDHDRRIWFN